MHVLVAGATGAVGRLLVPLLLDAGHQVTRSPGHQVTPARLQGPSEYSVKARQPFK
jgi:nucleoside-diphosphate-sugar epimerase